MDSHRTVSREQERRNVEGYGVGRRDDDDNRCQTETLY